MAVDKTREVLARSLWDKFTANAEAEAAQRESRDCDAAFLTALAQFFASHDREDGDTVCQTPDGVQWLIRYRKGEDGISHLDIQQLV